MHIEDIEETFRKEDEQLIIHGVKNNIKRYVDLFYEVADPLIPEKSLSVNPEDVFSSLNVDSEVRVVKRPS